jgi:hypothetical protein
MRGHEAITGAIASAALAGALGGCAALPLAVVAGSLLDAGGGVIVKTGTEYTASGAVRRTFNMPVDQVHAAVLETFARAQIPVTRDEASAKRHVVRGAAQHRKIYVELLPLTPVLTSLELVVKRNLLASDKATASELLARTELVIGERTPAADAPALARAVDTHRRGR